MALNGYFGNTGSGKSYSVVEYVVIPALQRGRHVVTNIPLEADQLVQVYGGKVTQLPLDVLDRPVLDELLPHGCVAVLDEVWRRWPSGQKVNKVSKEDLRLLKEHRHRVDADGNSMQVVLVTQFPSDLALWCRQLIAHSFHMDKLDTVGMAGKFSIKVYKGCPTGERIPGKLLVRDAIGTYKPEIYQFYRSATQSQATDLSVGDEKAMDRRANVWGSWQMIAILCFVPVGLVLGGYFFVYYFGMADRAREKEAAKHVPVQAESVQRLTAAPLPPMPRENQPRGSTRPVSADPSIPVPPAVPSMSGMWRIVGYVKHKDQNARPSAPEWPSRIAYSNPYEDGTGGDVDRWLEDVAILKSWGGTRLYPLSKCVRLEASRDYYCDVEGERITPWSGLQGASEVVGGRPVHEAKQVAQAAPVASGATHRVPPEPPNPTSL